MSEIAQLQERNASGAEWIGRVPDSWTLRPFFSVARQSRQSNKGLVEQNLLSLSYGKIIKKDITANEGLLPESFETYQIVEPDDMIFRLTDLQNDQRSLRTGLVTERGIITSAYLCVTPKGINPRFFAHAMRAADHRKVFYSRGDGLRQTLKYDDLKWLWVPFPPLSEQQKVVDFVDRETAKIDAMIKKQRALVGGLRERRQETIEVALHHEATGGVVTPLSAACSAIIDCNHSTPAVDPQGKHRAVRTGSVRSGSYRPEFDLLVSSETYEERTQGARPALGDVLFTREAPAGEACLVPINDVLCLGQRMVLLRPNTDLLHPSFLVYWIYRRSTQDYFRLQMNGSTVGNVRLGDIRSMKIALPSVDRQRAIVDYLDNKTARIDALIAHSERLIELSQERRSALITAAVTGQIDITSTNDTRTLEGAA